VTPDALSVGTLRRIDHVAVAVWDADAALGHFTRVLGLRVVHDEALPHVGVRLVYLSTDGTVGSAAVIQLVQPIAATAVRDHLSAHGEGLHHICFTVDNIDEVLAALPPEDAGAVFVGGRARRCAFLGSSPSGLRVELTEERRAAEGTVST
jgi:methylmalonyl-CoA/ethylmalonyl-CoA epimerase